MLPSRGAALTCDGKHVVSGRASFVWETFVLRRAAGVPGDYAIRRNAPGAPWHKISASIEEAEAVLRSSRIFGKGKVERARKTRVGRERRGLPVA
jgi:hypothetical protein